MINNNIKNFHDAIVKFINESGMPIAMSYFIVQNILRDMEFKLYATLNDELANQQQNKTTEQTED